MKSENGKINNISLAKWKSVLMQFTQMDQVGKVIFTKEQCYIALGNILTVAALMKIDAYPSEVLRQINMTKY